MLLLLHIGEKNEKPCIHYTILVNTYAQKYQHTNDILPYR